MSNKIKLDNCTLVCADGINDVSKLINTISENIQFADILIEKNIKSIQEYNLFCVKTLHGLLKQSHCMIVQHDGYPINYSSWNDKWLNLDYIGSPWINQPWDRDISVGNGGFSLRSKKLLQRVSQFEYDGLEPEDAFICRSKGRLLKSEGYTFATIEEAYSFAVEDTFYKGQFGFHGKSTIQLNKKFGIFK